MGSLSPRCASAQPPVRLLRSVGGSLSRRRLVFRWPSRPHHCLAPSYPTGSAPTSPVTTDWARGVRGRPPLRSWRSVADRGLAGRCAAQEPPRHRPIHRPIGRRRRHPRHPSATARFSTAATDRVARRDPSRRHRRTIRRPGRCRRTGPQRSVAPARHRAPPVLPGTRHHPRRRVCTEAARRFNSPPPGLPPHAIVIAFSTLLDTDFALALIDLRTGAPRHRRRRPTRFPVRRRTGADDRPVVATRTVRNVPGSRRGRRRRGAVA